MGSCVSYLPPSSLHVDAMPTRHAIVRDSMVQRAHLIDIQTYTYRGNYHHKRDPEIEENRGQGIQLGYSWAQDRHSFAFNSAYTFGRMRDNDENTYRHSNILLRTSYSLDKREGPWSFQILKLQASGSIGFGDYLDYLRTGEDSRDRYNLAINANQWYYSFGLASAMHHYTEKGHRQSMLFGFSRGTDFEKEGFRSNLLLLNLEFEHRMGIGLQCGGMLDARIFPRAETLYIGLSYTLSNKY